MTDYILIALAVTIIFYLERHRRILFAIREWAGILNERQLDLEYPINYKPKFG
jgi:hypothetical protein